MKHATRSPQPEFHIVAKCNVWKVYDRNQKYRCTFHSYADAQEYIRQNSKTTVRESR